jgi:hypothetical protein
MNSPANSVEPIGMKTETDSILPSPGARGENGNMSGTLNMREYVEEDRQCRRGRSRKRKPKRLQHHPTLQQRSKEAETLLLQRQPRTAHASHQTEGSAVHGEDL